MNKNSMGNRIKETRKKLGLTQEELAEKLEITPCYVGEIERDVKMPSLELFIKIVNVLDVSADYLLRDIVSVGNVYGDKRMERKIANLTPKQRVALEAIIDTCIEYLN